MRLTALKGNVENFKQRDCLLILDVKLEKRVKSIAKQPRNNEQDSEGDASGNEDQELDNVAERYKKFVEDHRKLLMFSCD
jgi:hypothetical protein